MPCLSLEGVVSLNLHTHGFLGSLVFEPTYLAWLSATTFWNPHGEIAQFVKHAWGMYASLFCSFQAWV